MSFTEDLARLPFNARQAEATGFLPPILRALGHLLYILGWVADEEKAMEDTELLAELNHAKEHWNAQNANGTLSTATVAQLDAFSAALASAITEWPDWERQARIQNIRDLANRGFAISVQLDRELLGLRNSDPGYNL